MPDLTEHLAQAARNEALSQQLEVQHPDWAVTALFYAAVHYVEAYFFDRHTPPQPQHYPTHHRRNVGVASRLPSVNNEYQALKTRSQDARYDCIHFTTGDVRHCRQAYLVPIKQHVAANLSVPLPIVAAPANIPVGRISAGIRLGRFLRRLVGK